MTTGLRQRIDSFPSSSGRPFSTTSQRPSQCWVVLNKVTSSSKGQRRLLRAARSFLREPFDEGVSSSFTSDSSCSGDERTTNRDLSKLPALYGSTHRSASGIFEAISSQNRICLQLLVASVTAVELVQTAIPVASIAAERLPTGLVTSFLDSVDSTGEFAPVFFVATVVGAELVPLFPTQPLIIASGLLFGTYKGAAFALLGTSSAAALAFQLSRIFGRGLAERVASEEITDESKRRGLFSRVQKAIDSGSFQQQLVAVTLLRLTPVVPFSASNYLLGATPLKFTAYLSGSVIGLSVWCAVFATLGGASRDLLRSGLSADVLMDQLARKAGAYTEDAAVGLAAVGLLVLLTFKISQYFSCNSPNGDDHKDEPEKV